MERRGIGEKGGLLDTIIRHQRMIRKECLHDAMHMTAPKRPTKTH